MPLLTHLLVALATCLLCFYAPNFQTWLLTGLLAALVASLLLAQKNSKEAYDLDHAVLNVQRPKTMWLNMGYWKDTSSFPEACEALARKLGDFAGIEPGDTVLDLGYGCGESTLVWARHFRPSRIIGVTSLASHKEQAQRALREAEDLPMDTSIELLAGNAVAWTREKSRDTASTQERFDRIIALDCAYHFETREEFLRNAFCLLEFTGTTALTDLLLPDSPLSSTASILLRIICFLSGVPFRNLLPTAAYRAQLVDIGYTGIEIQDITPQVFLGLAEYIEGLERDEVLRTALDQGKMRQYRYFARVLRWWNAGRLRFVMVRAMKGGKKRQ